MATLIIAESVAAPELTIQDANLLSMTAPLSSSIDGSEVAVDTCEAVILADYAVNTGLFIPAGADSLTTSDNKLLYVGVDEQILPQIPYGTKVEYYEGSSIIGVFYLENVTRVTKQTYQFDLMSGLGLLENKVHRGNVYNNITLADLLADIIGTTFSYTVDPAIASWPCFGWLPYDTARENLHRVLMAMGVNIFKSADGNPRFSVLDDSSPISVSDDDVYINGNVSYGSPATQVSVTEHQYLEAGGERVILFDNTDGGGAVTNAEVVFNGPHYDLQWTGQTLASSGSNYAVVSGIGVLTGIPYTHIQKIVTKNASPGSVKNREVSVTDDGLINPLNSNNVAQRLMDYYSAAQTVSGKMILGTPRPGTAITVTDAFGDSKTGIITNMEITASATVAATFEAVTDYTPDHFGNEFSGCIMVNASGTWLWTGTEYEKLSNNQSYTIPDDTDHIRVVLIGGGDGGYGGANGTDGAGEDDMTHSVTAYQNIYYYDGNEPDPGEGGAGGAAGNGGKILVIDQDVTPGETLTFSVGSGGVGGSANAGVPGPGTATTVQSSALWSGTSASGSLIPYGWKNLITGKTYGQKGIDGMDGADGGKSEQPGEDSNVPGGPAGANVWDWAGFAITASAKGGGGGGSGYNKSGMPGGPGRISYDHYASGGSGGTGASFSQNQGPHTAADEYGKGGDGGYGGGGGGNGGGVDARSTTGDGVTISVSGGTGGSGGYGSPGADGGNGAAFILY